MSAKIHNVPTNIISGFLGVGKTTAILNLFSQKRNTEKWSVLVNEFGKIGIDGQIYQAKGIAVKEIPGGCMCCAQGLPLQVAVNRLLRETRPDRLIIESSGIGHPAGVISTLEGDGFNDVLSLKAGICLIDPECLIKPNYQANELFREQIKLADVLVANKTDRASAEALQAYEHMAHAFNPAKIHVATTMNGVMEMHWLDFDRQSHTQETPFQLLTSQTEWQTHSFQFSKDTVFDVQALKQWLSRVNVLRMKGLIQTLDGRYLLNYSLGQSELMPLHNQKADQASNYIEVIDKNLNITSLEKGISKLIVNPP